MSSAHVRPDGSYGPEEDAGGGDAAARTGSVGAPPGAEAPGAGAAGPPPASAATGAPGAHDLPGEQSAPESVWPAPNAGAPGGAPAQEFRPQAGTEPGRPPGTADAETAEPAAAEEPVPGRAIPFEHGWDDGLIARRAPRDTAVRAEAPGTPAEPRQTAREPGTEAGAPGRNASPERRPSGSGGSPGSPGSPGSVRPGHAHPGPVRPAPVRPGPAHHAPSHSDAVRHETVRHDAARHDPARHDPARHDSIAHDAVRPAPVRPASVRPGERRPAPEAYRGIGDGTLRRRLSALRELIGLSRTRLEGAVLAEAGRVLDEAGSRSRLSGAYTTVAIAGATGSGKSSLFNALAGRTLSEVGLRRPTTAEPVACTWEAEREGGADGLLDRLGIAPGARRRVKDAELHGLVLVDLPDHDSVAPGHREQVDRLLGLVDAVVWVVDPEKYADAMLHERYLRPMAGHAEVFFVVLNQIDRLPGDAADAVLDDLRRLLDEDGMALGEHGEPGAEVLAISALTGSGIRELREDLAAFVATREAPGRRLLADLDGAAERLRPVYADPALASPAGLTEHDREQFEDRLAAAVGAAAAGQSAERAWLRYAERSCGTPWSQLVRWADARRQQGPRRAEGQAPGAEGGRAAGPQDEAGRTAANAPAAAQVTAGATPATAATTGDAEQPVRARVARPVLAQAVRELADRAVAGLPEAWRSTVRDAAWRGAEKLPEALDAVLAEAAPEAGAGAGEEPGDGTRDEERPARMPRPPWWTAATAAQGLLLALQVLGVFLLAGAVFGAYGGSLWVPVLLLLGGAVCGPVLAAACRAAARGPARAYGQEEERRLRQLAAGCGRTRVLEPVAAELLRYREVREQYVVAAGDADRV